jgi:hypothetical protein
MCWSSHRDYRDSWAVERQPRADVRASDSDRQTTIDQLSRHTADGRLTLEDFEERVDEAWQARTHGDLRHVLRELPTDRPAIRRTYPRGMIRAALLWAVILVAATVLIGPGALWWLVPLAFFRFRGFGHHHHRARRDRWHELPRGDDLTLV